MGYTVNPIIIVGNNPRRAFLIRFVSLSNVLKYRFRMASTAPNWMAISNVLRKLESGIERSRDATIRCPVEDIGRNSVIPSISDRMMM